MSPTATQIEATLRQAFDPIEIRVKDRSAAHASHVEAQEAGGGHYEVRIVASRFAGLTPVARHRLVYDTLRGYGDGIHALALATLTPEEAGST